MTQVSSVMAGPTTRGGRAGKLSVLCRGTTAWGLWGHRRVGEVGDRLWGDRGTSGDGGRVWGTGRADEHRSLAAGSLAAQWKGSRGKGPGFVELALGSLSEGVGLLVVTAQANLLVIQNKNWSQYRLLLIGHRLKSTA